jgi:carboxyl-terminal processing protease
MPEYAQLPYINPEKELKESDLSDQVKTAEQMLNALDLNPGNVDGYYDEDTTKAVKQFQEKNELKVTGTLNAETTVKLMSNLRDKLKENDPQVKKAIEELNQNN